MGKKSIPKIDLEKVDVVVQKNILLGMDVLIVNSGLYMLTVSSFKYKNIGVLNKTMTKDADTFRFHIRYHVNEYRARVFAVTKIRTDIPRQQVEYRRARRCQTHCHLRI